MDSCSYMCAECLQFFDSIDIFDKHGCKTNTIRRQEPSASSQEEPDMIKSSDQEPQSSTAVTQIEDLSDARKEKPHVPSKKRQTSQKHEDRTDSISELADLRYDIIPGKKNAMKNRKSYLSMDDSYRLNRTMRDKDFKLTRSNLYSFKDTLGDWDERSTQLLIQLIHKYPHTYFLLPVTNDRRMVHWEKLHKEMETAGYNFTILQLRMRWREVLQKYRWTVNYNDFHEIKKRCEYFDEMTELCGDWDKDATQALLEHMQRIKQENQRKKIVRIGYSGWEKITENLNMEGHKYTVQMVEGRWRNLVTLYKTMVDHNNIPNVEPQIVAYKNELEELVKYAPQRRNNYEKKVGRSVKIEKFPSSGCRILLQAYKDCMSRFVDPKFDNRILWDEITQKLADEGLNFATSKLKEILTGMIKGFEKCQYHNSLPGAIHRDVPHYRELAEVYGVYGRWPHIHTSRTMEMRNKRKHRLRLQVSQQLWLKEESQVLLQVYPDVLEAHVNHCLNHQPSDLWLQVAKAYAATGYPKQDVPEIAVHIGLLRQGYAQNNKFPFIEEMRKVKEAEEAVCYSPDVSKYTGEVEIIYWSHEAVNLLLDMYIKHQLAAASSHASRNEVFLKICDSMKDLGYKYTVDEISEKFKFLLIQYNTRKSKPWMLPPVGRLSHNPVGAPYLDKLQKICELRRQMSLSWTKGVKPLMPPDQKILFQVACQKADELLIEMATEREKKLLLGQIVDGVIVHIRTNRLIDPVPHTRQVRLHIADTIKNFDVKREKNKDVARLYKLFRDYDMLGLMCHLSLGAEMDTKTKHLPDNSLEFVRDSSNNISNGWISEEEHLCVVKSQEIDEACEYLALAVCYMSKGQDQMNIAGKGMNAKLENSTNIFGNVDADSESVQSVEILDSLDKSLVVNGNDTNGPSSRESLKCPLKTGMITKDESEITSYFRRNTCTNALHQDGADEFYDNLFGKIHSAFPKHCTRQSNNILYTISRESDFDLRMLLPKELMLDVESVFVNKTEVSKKQSKNKIDKRLPQEAFIPNTSDLDLNNVLTDEQMSSEDIELSDSVSQNGENLEIKIIQTRSGRKTQYNFFPETLDDDFDDKSFEGSDLPNADVKSPSKKIKLESNSYSFLKGKRGRPRKSQEARNSNLHLKTNGSLQDPVFSHITNHLNNKTTQEKKFVKIMREQQEEHSDILREICSIIDKLTNKFTKTNSLGTNTHT